jgi:hypothetical protein
MRRISLIGLLACGTLGLAAWAGPVQAQAEPGFRLSAQGVVIDQAAHWDKWSRPKHAVEIDPLTHTVRPSRLRTSTNAIEDLDRFQTRIGDDKAYEKLLKDLDREGRPLPLNIRTAPASVAGVPIVYLKGDDKKGIKEGDPIVWNYFHGGIRYTANNPQAAPRILDGDPATYWEPGSAISQAEYQALPAAQKGPVYYFAKDAGGQERRVDRQTYEATAGADRRIEYHSRSLDSWYVDVDLGRLVPVQRIVLRFVEPELGEPFRQVRILGTPSDLRDAPLSLLARTITPNEDQTLVEFDLDPNDEGVFQQLQILRIAVTDSRFDKFREISAEEFLALSPEDQGGIDYHIVNAAGTQTRVDKEIYDQVAPERRGRLVYYQRERPRLADIEVWTQGDNIALDLIDGGGSVALTGTFAGDPGFDGRFESDYLQLVWSPDPRFDNRGVLTVDLGASFWLNFFRMVGGISGVDEMVVRASDGTRDANGNLKWAEIHRQMGGTVEKGFDDLLQVRYITSQIFSNQAGRAGGYNTGDGIREFQIFGEGYPSEVTLTSPLIELPGAVILGTIEWEADLPDEQVEVQIRTRTGDRLIEVTNYYGSGGEPKTETEYNKLPKSFQGPIVTRLQPGGGWSSWSQRYESPGELVTSPSPRRYLQIQARLLSRSPDRAAGLRVLRVHFLPPVARRTIAEIWPNDVPPGQRQDFELYLNPTFVERQPAGEPSRRFDEILLDAAPIREIEVLDVSLGREEDFAAGTGRTFSALAQRQDPATGALTPWFTDAQGTSYKALVEPSTGDTLRVFFPGLGEGAMSTVRLRLPEKIALQPAAAGSRVYHRTIGEEGEEVPVDDDGRLLNELTYLGLTAAEQGRILYFAIAGRNPDGTPVEQAIDLAGYRALPDTLKGTIRYFRKLVGKGGEFPFDQDGNPLTQAAYNALPSAERGSIMAAGELVRVRFGAQVLLNGTTIDVSVRDSAAPESWQQVDAGEATAQRPGSSLSISVPFTARVLRDIDLAPNPFTPNADGVNDRVQIRFAIGNLNADRPIQVQVFDLSGRLVWQERHLGFGEQGLWWDGRSARGEPVPPGLYLCRIAVDVDARQASHQVVQRLIAVAY